MRSAALLAASLACAGVACAGVALLAFLFIVRTFSPAKAQIVRPLYFDYTKLEATASVSLLNSQRSTAYAHSLHEVNHKARRFSVSIFRVRVPMLFDAQSTASRLWPA